MPGQHTLSEAQFQDLFSQERRVGRVTNRPITLYVREDGSDDNDGLTEATALRQPQAALQKSRLGDTIDHDCLIDVGPGNFEGFSIQGFHLTGEGQLTVRGTLGAATLTTGTASGTATSGDKDTLIDSGQNWTTNELRGLLVKIGDEYRVVRENTGDTIELCGEFSEATNGKSYEILDRLTKVSGLAGGGVSSIYGYAVIQVFHTTGGHRVLIENFDVDAAGATIGVYAGFSTGVYFYRCKVDGKGTAVYGIWGQNVYGYGYYTYECYATDATSHGYGATQSSRISWRYSYAYGNGGNGFQSGGNVLGESNQWLYADANGANGFQIGTAPYWDFNKVYAKGNTKSGMVVVWNPGAWVDLDGGAFEDNGEYGIVVGWSSLELNNPLTGSALNGVGSIVCSGNTSGGVAIGWNSTACFSALTGNGNGGHGLTFLSESMQSSVKVTSDTAVTGSSGDASVDAGGVTLSWATDFAADGDKAINLDTLSVIKRED